MDIDIPPEVRNMNITEIQEQLHRLEIREERLKKREHELGLEYTAVSIQRAQLNLALFLMENSWKME